MGRESVESVRQVSKRSTMERICQRAKSSVQIERMNAIERVRHDESGDSEDELPCVIGGEHEGDSI